MTQFNKHLQIYTFVALLQMPGGRQMGKGTSKLGGFGWLETPALTYFELKGIEKKQQLL